MTMRKLGIDYGDARVGIAITDELGITAQGLESIHYNGNDKDLPFSHVIGGHNLAALASFGKVFGSKDFTASIFAIGNFGRKEITSVEREMLKLSGASDEMLTAVSGTSLISIAMLYYSPIKELKVGLGPSLTFKTFETNPTISLKLSATLGGGNF